MTGSVYLPGAQGAERNIGDRSGKIPCHHPRDRHVLEIRQGVHSLHVRKKEPSTLYLAKPFIIFVMQGITTLANFVPKEEGWFLHWDARICRKCRVSHKFSEGRHVDLGEFLPSLLRLVDSHGSSPLQHKG